MLNCSNVADTKFPQDTGTFLGGGLGLVPIPIAMIQDYHLTD